MIFLTVKESLWVIVFAFPGKRGVWLERGCLTWTPLPQLQMAGALFWPFSKHLLQVASLLAINCQFSCTIPVRVLNELLILIYEFIYELMNSFLSHNIFTGSLQFSYTTVLIYDYYYYYYYFTVLYSNFIWILVWPIIMSMSKSCQYKYLTLTEKVVIIIEVEKGLIRISKNSGFWYSLKHLIYVFE